MQNMLNSYFMGWDGRQWNLLFVITIDSNFQGNATLIEEGRYSETDSLASWVSSPGSIRFVSEDLSNPELLLVSSTNFDGKHSLECYVFNISLSLIFINLTFQLVKCDFNYVTENTPPWTKADASVKLMKTISVGHGGIWAVNAKDDRWGWYVKYLYFDS